MQLRRLMIIGIISCTIASCTLKGQQVGILDNSDNAEAWQTLIQEKIDKDVLLINERQLGLSGKQFKVLEKGISRDSFLPPKDSDKNIDILLIPNSHIYGFSAAIERFVENGGKILATQGAGYIDGKYTMINSLRVGKRNITIPLLYWHYLDHDQEAYRKLAEWCAIRGADGLGMYSYIWTLAPEVKDKFMSSGLGKQKSSIYANMPDTTPTITECFAQWDKWKTKRMPGLLGQADAPKVLFCKSWLISGPYASSSSEIVNYARRTGANTINLDFPLQPVYKHDVYDFLEELERLCQAHNIKLWLDVFINGKNFSLQDNERQISEKGVKNKGIGAICPLGGKETNKESIQAMVDLLKRYPYVNALLLDEPWLWSRNKKSWCCFCDACKHEFKKRYGRELTVDEIESPDFMEFREKIQTEFFTSIANAVNHLNPRIRLGFWTCPSYELCGINPQMAGNAGFSIWGLEYPRALREYGDVTYSVEGNDPDYLSMSGLNAFRQQFHIFNKLILEEDHTILKGIDLSKFKGRGNIIDVFNGGKILAWMTDGTNSYPAIVLSHEDRCIYFAFDPSSQGQMGTKLLENAIKFLKSK